MYHSRRARGAHGLASGKRPSAVQLSSGGIPPPRASLTTSCELPVIRPVLQTPAQYPRVSATAEASTPEGCPLGKSKMDRHSPRYGLTRSLSRGSACPERLPPPGSVEAAGQSGLGHAAAPEQLPLKRFSTPLFTTRVHQETQSLPASGQPAVDEHHQSLWRESLGQLQALQAGGQHAEAYIMASQLLSREQNSCERTAALHALRALSSFALLNYKECIGDCTAAFTDVNSFFSSAIRLSAGDAAGSNGEIDYAALVRAWARSHVMREEYCAAKHLYDLLLGQPSPDAASPPLLLSPLERATMVSERQGLSAVEAFRFSVAQEDWRAAQRHIPAARPLLEGSPLCVLQSLTLLECGDVEGARTALLPYLPTLPVPPTRTSATQEDPLALLRCNADAHFVFTSALLAKASVYSGRAYMNIAAALLQRCLLVNASYTPAVRLAEYVVRVEEAFDLAEDDVSPAVKRALEEAIDLDRSNHRVTAALYLKLAEVSLKEGSAQDAIRDCTRSIEADAESTLGWAFVVRARAHDAAGRPADATQDRASARRVNPRLTDEVFQRSQQQGPSSSARQPSPANGFRPNYSNSGAGDNRECCRPPAAVAERATLYDVLGVPRTATEAQIRRSFRALTLRYHPDKLVGESAAVRAHALEMFKRVNNANGVLSDAVRRQVYDMTLLHD